MSPPQQQRQRTSNCSSLLIYRLRKDERLSLPSWLTYTGWFTHINGHPSATGRAQDSESTPAKDRCSTAGPRNQRCLCHESRSGCIQRLVAGRVAGYQVTGSACSLQTAEHWTDVGRAGLAAKLAVLAALSCYRLSHRDSTFVNWIAEQHLYDRCGLRDRTCVGPRRVGCLHGPTRAER